MGNEFEECNEPHYVGEDNSLFYIDCGIDVSAASVVEVNLRRPDGTIISKSATPGAYNGSPDYVFFRISASDFNQIGKYTGQARVFIGAWSGWGHRFEINVEAPISSSSCSSSSRSSSSSCKSSSSSSSSSAA